MDAIICPDACIHEFCMELRKYSVEEKELLEEMIKEREEPSGNQNQFIDQKPKRMTWKELVEMAICQEDYAKCLEKMLEDKIYSEGDMEVISMYTRDVCNLYPENATKMQALYSAFAKRMNKKKQPRQYCVIL